MVGIALGAQARDAQLGRVVLERRFVRRQGPARSADNTAVLDRRVRGIAQRKVLLPREARAGREAAHALERRPRWPCALLGHPRSGEARARRASERVLARHSSPAGSRERPRPKQRATSGSFGQPAHRRLHLMALFPLRPPVQVFNRDRFVPPVQRTGGFLRNRIRSRGRKLTANFAAFRPSGKGLFLLLNFRPLRKQSQTDPKKTQNRDHQNSCTEIQTDAEIFCPLPPPLRFISKSCNHQKQKLSSGLMFLGGSENSRLLGGTRRPGMCERPRVAHELGRASGLCARVSLPEADTRRCVAQQQS